MKTKSVLAALISLGLLAGVAEAEGHKQQAAHKGRDANSDHVLSLDEFLANRKHVDKAKARFEGGDTNHDGKLEKSERQGMKKDGKREGKKQHGKKRHHQKN